MLCFYTGGIFQLKNKNPILLKIYKIKTIYHNRKTCQNTVDIMFTARFNTKTNK